MRFFVRGVKTEPGALPEGSRESGGAKREAAPGPVPTRTRPQRGRTTAPTEVSATPARRRFPADADEGPRWRLDPRLPSGIAPRWLAAEENHG